MLIGGACLYIYTLCSHYACVWLPMPPPSDQYAPKCPLAVHLPVPMKCRVPYIYTLYMYSVRVQPFPPISDQRYMINLLFSDDSFKSGLAPKRRVFSAHDWGPRGALEIAPPLQQYRKRPRSRLTTITAWHVDHSLFSCFLCQ